MCQQLIFEYIFNILSYCVGCRVDGLQAVIITDRDGVPILKIGKYYYFNMMVLNTCLRSLLLSIDCL